MCPSMTGQPDMLVNIITYFQSVKTTAQHPIFICEWYLPICMTLCGLKRSERTTALDPTNVGIVTKVIMESPNDLRKYLCSIFTPKSIK